MSEKIVKKCTETQQDLEVIWPDFVISINEIMNPNSNIAVRFFERFVSGQLQLSIVELQQSIQQSAIYSKLFNDISYCEALYIITHSVFKYLEILDQIQSFHLLDLLQPTNTMFRKQFLVVANFIFYITGMQYTMHTVKNKILKSLNNISNLKKKSDEQNEKLNAEAIQRLKKNDKKEELKKNPEVFIQCVNQQRTICEQLVETTKLLKRERQTLEDENEKLVTVLKNELAIQEKIQPQIVTNRTTILEECKISEEKLAQNILKNTDIEKNLETKKLTISNASKMLDAINKFNESKPEEKIPEEFKLIVQLQNKNDEETKYLTDSNIKITDLKINAKNKLKEIALLKEKSQSFVLDEENCKQMNVLKAEYIQIMKDYEHKIKVYGELDKKIKHVTECCEQNQQKIEEQTRFFDQKYGTILKLKSDIDNKFNDTLTSVTVVLNGQND